MKEESGNVAEVMGNLTIETTGTEEEAAKNIGVILGMEIEVEVENKVEGEEGGVET